MANKKIIKVNGSGSKKRIAEQYKKNAEVDLDAQERLAEIANDTPKKVKIGDKEYSITALKWGTQWLIAEEAVKIRKAETSNTMDVLQQFAINIPSTIKIIALIILNDKDKIFKDSRKKEYSDEYYALYDTIEWESKSDDWIKLVAEAIAMINIEVFFYTTDAIQTIRQVMTQRKTTMAEAKLSLQEQNGE